MKELVAGQKAKAKAGLHGFELGQEIEFVKMVEEGFYEKLVCYEFIGDIGGEVVDQHLTENEFEIIS